MERTSQSRREFLTSGAAIATTIPLAGCLSHTAQTLRLSAYERESLPDSVLVADPTAPTAQFAIDYPDRYKRDRYRTLIQTGSMTVLNYQLTYTYEFGSETREAARFIVDEGLVTDDAHPSTSTAPSTTNTSTAPSTTNTSTAPSTTNTSTAPSTTNTSTAPSTTNTAQPTDGRPSIDGSEATYYRVHIENERSVERDWWEFYLDLVADPPAAAEGVVPPLESLSDTDRQIVDAALGAVYADRNHPIDVGTDAFGTRGPLYHECLNAGESALVPDPPFEYVRTNDRLFAARADRGTATPTETTYTAEPVAETRTSFEDHVRSTLIATDLSPGSLPDEEAAVVRTAVRTPFYEEELPMSGPLRSVMERLGAGEHLPADDAFELGIDFDHLFATVDGTVFAFDLSVQP